MVIIDIKFNIAERNGKGTACDNISFVNIPNDFASFVPVIKLY